MVVMMNLKYVDNLPGGRKRFNAKSLKIYVATHFRVRSCGEI